MTFWVFLILLIGLFFTSVFIFQVQASSIRKIQTKAGAIPLPVARLSVGCVVPLLLLVSMYVLNQNDFSVHYITFVGAILFGIVWTAISCTTHSKGFRSLLLFLLCFLSVCLFPETMAIYKMSPLPPVMVQVLLALFWAGFVLMFEKLDRVPFLSVSTTLCFLIFFAFYIGLFNALPFFWIYLITILWALSLVQNAFLQIRFDKEFGRSSFSFVGFIWGYFLIMVAVDGAPVASVILASYYLFEIILAVMFTLIHTKRVWPVGERFMIEKLLAAHPNSVKKIMKFITMRSILIAMIAVLAAVLKTSVGSVFYILCLLIVFIEMYSKMTAWQTKKIGYRDVINDVKTGFKELKNEINRLPMKKQEAPVAPVQKKQVAAPEKTQAKKSKVVKAPVQKKAVVAAPKKKVKKAVVQKGAPKRTSVKKVAVKGAGRKKARR
ncbi:MAG: hypothetical protein LBU87_04320 [Lactobacillales bacterium]|jgi:hypothetical protein|nr:hypothetical protein [Lactobacillales bacterium]